MSPPIARRSIVSPWPFEPVAQAPDRRAVPTLSCVIPCRNEVENLAQLLPALKACLAQCTRAWEIILVDDGSTDGTPMLISSWARQAGFRAVLLSRNFGKEAALTAGLQASAGEVVVMMDADLQHPPDLIASFVSTWLDGADVVYAVREHRHDESAFKRLGTSAFYALLNASDRFNVPAGAGDFRLLDRAVVDTLLALPERNRFMKGLYAWVGFDSVAIPYVPEERLHGKSHFSAWQLIRLSMDGLTAFTTWPLRAVSAMGFVMALLSLLYGAYLSVSYLMNGNGVSGWTTIVVSLMLISGIQLVSIGVVGEYVGRIFEEVKARPLYIVKREIGLGLNQPPAKP
jgi:glycosyltransferase involved in cell wall biosynthesis